MCSQGYVWSIKPNGDTDYPNTISVIDHTVFVFDDYGEVNDAYSIFYSLVQLATDIEKSNNPYYGLH